MPEIPQGAFASGSLRGATRADDRTGIGLPPRKRRGRCHAFREGCRPAAPAPVRCAACQGRARTGQAKKKDDRPSDPLTLGQPVQAGLPPPAFSRKVSCPRRRLLPLSGRGRCLNPQPPGGADSPPRPGARSRGPVRIAPATRARNPVPSRPSSTVEPHPPFFKGDQAGRGEGGGATPWRSGVSGGDWAGRLRRRAGCIGRGPAPR